MLVANMIPNPFKLVSVAEMQTLERKADERGHSYATMMEMAGKAVADSIQAQGFDKESKILILVGPGNNGGDGLVCAKYLEEEDFSVRIYFWKRSIDLDSGVASYVPTAHADDDYDWVTLLEWLEKSDLVVDALLGTGNNRPITDELFQQLLAVVDFIGKPVFAVDCPTGINSDTGAVDPATVSAHTTVTFGYPKQGHYKFPAPTVMGRYTIADIGIPDWLADNLKTFLLDREVVRFWLPDRASNSHKGTFGKAILAVGSFHYPGAAYLSCSAAGRSGAGLVTGAIPRPLWEPLVSKLAEPTWLPLPASSEAEGGVFSPTAADLLLERIAGYHALVVGCGLGNWPSSQQFIQRLFQHKDQLPATLIDADGLNCLAQWPDWHTHLPAQTVLTPHVAEMARLCDLSVSEVSANRWALAREKAAEWQAVMLVKGPYTVITEPKGLLAVLPIATPALATAGTGDVLSGTIGGLLAQGVPPFEAACLGAWLHGQAGLLCQQEIGSSGVLASDLLPRLPRAINALREYIDENYKNRTNYN